MADTKFKVGDVVEFEIEQKWDIGHWILIGILIATILAYNLGGSAAEESPDQFLIKPYIEWQK